MKFIFPNRHSVYLHDTPNRTLFGRDTRSLSSGCVRVKDPMKFAEYVLSENTGWDRAKIDATVETRRRTRVNLDAPLTVALLYWTVDVVSNDDVIFHDDVYDRDSKLIAALNAPFKLD